MLDSNTRQISGYATKICYLNWTMNVATIYLGVYQQCSNYWKLSASLLWITEYLMIKTSHLTVDTATSPCHCSVMYIQHPLSVLLTPQPWRAQPSLQNTQMLLTTIKLLHVLAFPRERTSAVGLTSIVCMISIIRVSAGPSHSDTPWWLFKCLTLMQIKWWLVLGKAVINLWLEVGQMNGTRGL